MWLIQSDLSVRIWGVVFMRAFHYRKQSFLHSPIISPACSNLPICLIIEIGRVSRIRRKLSGLSSAGEVNSIAGGTGRTAGPLVFSGHCWWAAAAEIGSIVEIGAPKPLQAAAIGLTIAAPHWSFYWHGLLFKPLHHTSPFTDLAPTTQTWRAVTRPRTLME